MAIKGIKLAYSNKINGKPSTMASIVHETVEESQRIAKLNLDVTYSPKSKF